MRFSRATLRRKYFDRLSTFGCSPTLTHLLVFDREQSTWLDWLTGCTAILQSRGGGGPWAERLRGLLDTTVGRVLQEDGRV